MLFRSINNCFLAKYYFCFLVIFVIALSSLYGKEIPYNQCKQIYYFNKTWGFVKYYNSKQAKKINIDKLYLKYIQKFDTTLTNTEFNNILSNFLNEFNPPKQKNQFENFQELKVKHHWIYDSIIFEKRNIEKLENILKFFKSSTNKYVKNRIFLGGAPEFYDSTYFSIKNPDKNIRMLALARYWNIIDYFYPYPEMLTENWDSTLVKFIPKFYMADGIEKYSKVVLLLISNINDSHAITFSNYLFYNISGYYLPLFKTSFIENKTVVSSFYGNDSTVKLGDVILEINNIKINKLRDSISQYISASNDASKNRIINDEVLRSKDSISYFKILRKIDTLNIIYKNIGKPQLYNIYIKNKALSQKVIHFSNEISYLYLENIYRKDLKKIFAEVIDKEIIIIDLRKDVNAVLYTLLNHFSSYRIQFACLSVANTKTPCTFKNLSCYLCGSNKSSKYKGKIVLLVNEYTQSELEFTTMALQTLPNVVTIGSKTAGTDGNVVKIMLPGGLTTMFSSINITYPDGTKTQGKGIKIDYFVYPTISGLLNGNDELIDFVLKEKLKLFENK